MNLQKPSANSAKLNKKAIPLGQLLKFLKTI